MKPADTDDLGVNRLLALLPDSERARLGCHFTRVELEAGRMLQREGADIEYVYFPASGIVANVLAVPDAPDVTVSIVGREGALFCDRAASLAHSFVRATVRRAGIALRMPVSLWQEVSAPSPTDNLVCAYNALCVSETQQNAACCLLHDVESKVCRWMLHVHDRLDGAAIAMTHAELASLAGTRRSTVTLITGALEAAGIIVNCRGKIEVVDRFALEAAACECYQTIRKRREDFELRFSRASNAALSPANSGSAELAL